MNLIFCFISPSFIYLVIMSPYALPGCDNFSNFYRCILFYCTSLYCTSQILWPFYFCKLKFVQPFIKQNSWHHFPKVFIHFMSLYHVSVILLIFHAYIYPTKNHLNYKANANSHESGNRQPNNRGGDFNTQLAPIER